MARISDQLFGAPPSALRGAEDDEAALLAELDAKASAVRRPAPAATTAAPSEDEAALLQELDAVAHQVRVTQAEGGKVSRFAKGAGSTLAKPGVMAATVERAGAGLGMAVSASDVAEYDTLSPEQQGRIKRELGGEDVSWTERLPFTDTHLPGNTGPAVRRFEGSMPGTPDAARAGAAAARLAEARIGQNAPGAQLADSYGGDAPVFDRVQRAQGAARLMGEDRSPLAVDMFEASAEKAAEVQETVLDPHRREMYQRYGEAGALGSGLIESVPSLAAGIGIGVATRNAAAGARVALPTAARLGAVTGAGSQGAMSAGTAYADAVDKGLNPELARVYALGYGAAELIPSAWSLDTILSAGGRNALARMGIGAATEGAQESITAVLQAAIDKGMVDPDMTFGEAWDRIWQGAMLGSMLGGPVGVISGIGADTENTEGRNSPGADAATNGQPPLQNPPGLTADELLAVIQQNTGAPANAEPMSPEMARQQKIEQARARAQTERELTDTFTNSTDVLRRENVAVTDDGLEVPDAAAPAQDPLGRHADPRSDHYALTVLAKDLSDELGFQARPEDLDLIAQDIARGTDPKRAVRDRMKAGEAFAIAQRRRERKASALGQDETNPENLRDFRAGAPTDYTGTDGEPLPTTITPRMQQEREAVTADRAALNPQVNRGQPGMSPRDAVDRISTDAASGLRGTHIPGQQPDFGPSSPMPRQGETFDATEFDQQERQRQNTQQGRGLPESVTLGRNQQELRPGFTDNTGDQAVATHPGRPQDAAPVEQPTQPTQPTQPERAIDRLRKRRADKRPAPQTPDVIVPETDGELPDLDLGPEPEARRPMSPDEDREMETWAAIMADREAAGAAVDAIPANSGMEAAVDAMLQQGHSMDDIVDALETKLSWARTNAAAAGTDRAERAPAEAEVARLQGIAYLLQQRAENTDTRPDFELTPDDQEQTPAAPEQTPAAPEQTPAAPEQAPVTPANPAVLSSDQATDQETETDGNPGTLQRETDTDTAADDNGAGAGAVRSVASRRQESGEPIPRADERDVNILKANTLSSKPARGMATDAVRRLADKFVADLSGALGVKIEVLAKQTDHPQLAQLAENGETVRAGYNPRTKTVTLVAENLANAEAVFAALRHEILGHHGLRSVLSDADYKRVIDAILATKGKSKGLDAVWETVDANYGDAGDIIRAEEVFTHVAERGLTNLGAAWAKVKAAVLQALRKVGLLPKTQISEAEVQALVQSIAQGMKQGVGRDDGPGSPGGDLRFSKSSNNPNRRDLTADEKIGQPAPAAPKSFVDQLEDLGTRLLSGQLSQAAQVAETEILDRFLPVKALEAKMRKFGKDITAATSAYVSMRLSTSVGSVVEAMLRFGAPQWQGGVIQHKPGTIGLLDAFGKLGSDTALNDWLAWMAAHRAEELMRSGRESNLDRNDIRELKARVGDRAALFEEVRKDYNAIKSAVLDLQQSVGLIDPDSRAQWESNWYVPFYRADESVLELDITGREDVKGKSSKLKTLRNKNRLSNQDSVIKALKGSELPTRDLLSNIMANLSGGIDAAMKQDAMVKLVRNLSDAEVGVMSRLGFENQVSAAQRNADGVFYVRERGRKVYYHVDTTQFDGQELYHTIAELGWLRTNDGAMGATLRLGRMFKRVLTRGITATPPFIVRNMLRDSVSAWMISPDHFRLGVDTARGIKESLKQGEYARAMAFAGATFQGGFLSDTDPDAVRNEIKRMLAAHGMAQEEAAAFAGSVVLTPAHMKRLAKLMLAGPHLALSKWLTFGERMENANRIAVYMRALENGRSAADAAYEGKDLMDYSLMGRSNVIKFLSDISPFMNARIQGNYKTVRSLANRHTLARGLMVAGATLLLAAMNAGEDWYERLPDWERDTYWHIKAGDELFRIAKPFELGVMFATVPERLGRLALNESGIAPNDETGKTVLASLGWNLWNTSQIFTMPSPVSAAWQLGTNTNSFTKLPIETQADRSVSKSQRYGEHTSVTLVAAGDELEAMGLSPKQAEHLVGAIFGTVGIYALAAADGITRRVTDAPEKPEARAHESRAPGFDMLGILYQGNVNDVPVRTKHEDEFYKMLKETGQVYATFDKLAREGQAEKARELLAERPGAIQMAQSLAKTGMALRKLQDAQAAIVKDPKMTATEKRRRIDKIRAARQAITKQQVETARPLLDKDE